MFVMALHYLSCKISTEGTFKSLSLRGVVMTVVSRESLNLGQSSIYNPQEVVIAIVCNAD